MNLHNRVNRKTTIPTYLLDGIVLPKGFYVSHKRDMREVLIPAPGTTKNA